MLTLYGLASCDTCRRARALFATRGIEHSWVDLAASPPDTLALARWLERIGEDALVNRRSTTWRGLDPAERARPAVELLAAHPRLIKRPLLCDGERVHCGGREGDWLAFAGAG